MTITTTYVRSQRFAIERVYAAIRKKVLTFIWMRRKLNAVPSDYGVLLTPNWQDATFRYCVFASYGMFYSDYLRSLNREFDFLDIGANQGIYSLIAAKNRFCRKVHSFEPVARLARLIDANAALNDVRKVQVHAAAVSDQGGSRVALLDPNHTGGTQISLTESPGNPSQRDARSVERHEVACVSTSFIESILECCSPAVHLKIDVEGHETQVFAALFSCKNFCKIRSILYEVDLRWIDPDTILAKLTERGFTDFTVIGDGTHYDVLAKRKL